MSNFKAYQKNKINNENAFINTCYNGDLNLAKQLLNDHPNIDIFREKGITLRITCPNKYFDFAEWLLSFNPEKDIYEGVFLELCYHGHLDSAKWLLSMRPNIDVTIKNNYAFVWSCEYAKYAWSYTYLETAKWLLSLKPYYYILNLDKYGCFLSYAIRDLKDTKWLERRMPLLAYHTNTDNAFKKLNLDVIREICLFI